MAIARFTRIQTIVAFITSAVHQISMVVSFEHVFLLVERGFSVSMTKMDVPLSNDRVHYTAPSLSFYSLNRRNNVQQHSQYTSMGIVSINYRARLNRERDRSHQYSQLTFQEHHPISN